MPLIRRRGRPKQSHPETDHGTPELQLKKACYMTTEPLDWLREQELITAKQHWCGLHLRWLYTLRYGAFTPQAVDAAREQGIFRRHEYEEWQKAREAEWRHVTSHLKTQTLLQPALKICIYQQQIPQDWLVKSEKSKTPTSEYKEALRFLEKLWCRRIKFH